MADILNELLGTEYTESKFRKQRQAFDKMLAANQSKFVDSDAQLKEIEIQKRELERKKIQFRDERNAWQKQNYIDAFNTMVDGYNTTLAMTDDIHTVWYNAVFDLQDFDAALQRHFSSSTYKSKAKELNANVFTASEYMVKLSKVPNGYERQYKAIENYYDYYYDFAQCALNPSGSLLSYTQDINNLSDSAHRYYSECYNYIEAW